MKVCIILVVQYLPYKYHIARNFHRSTFLRIAVSEGFADSISLICYLNVCACRNAVISLKKFHEQF